MITKDKVTEIFYIIDEFDKNLDGELKKNLHLPTHNGNGKRYRKSVVSKKVCKLTIILIFALSNKKQQEYGTYTRTNFGNYFELHK